MAARRPLQAFVQALRPHQWSKNLLLVVPAVMGQVWMRPEVMVDLAVGFVAFCLVASGGYLVNDLLDVEADRRHPEKRRRPFAAGDLPRAAGYLLGPALILAGLALGWVAVNGPFGGLLAVYAVVAILYSSWLKHQLLLDVIVLASLYTLRLLAGGAAAGVEVSSWLLGFAMFFFLSLAFAKRLLEIAATGDADGGAPVSRTRPYRPVDLPAFRSMGPTSGLLSILVLALYVASDAVKALYGHPGFLWLLCPLLLYWIRRVWFLALRGELHHYPVVFALTDRVSYVVIAAVGVVLFLATR